MKNIFAAASILILSACTTINFVTQATASPEEDLLLAETVLISKDVKEFGKTIGITPSGALSKSSNEKPATSYTWIWIQKKGSLLYSTLSAVALEFGSVKEKIFLQKVLTLHGDIAIHWRSENQYSDNGAVITMDFATLSKARIVEVIFHEDLHANIIGIPWHDYEAIVTPLGCLAALEYFKRENDWKNFDVLKKRISEMSAYSDRLNEMASSPLPDGINEAQETHNLAYYRHFRRIVSLYERSGNLKLLIDDLLSYRPAKSLEEYLDYLDQKYQNPAL